VAGVPFASVAFKATILSMTHPTTLSKLDIGVADSKAAWWRLALALALMTVGASGMYIVSVVMPAVQAEFGITRADASLAYTFTLIGFGLGGILMGRLGDRYGVALPLAFAGTMIGLGFVVCGLSQGYWMFAIVHGVFIGLLGSSATFAPLLADTTFWFEKKRGIAVAICASGNYLGGAIWPPVVQHFTAIYGWRSAYIGIGIFCFLTMVPLALWMHRGTAISRALRARAALAASDNKTVGTTVSRDGRGTNRPLNMNANTLLMLLSVAGVGCCVAMSMPQVHIVSYCNDLGFGTARGAQMLSTMLAFGIASRLISGAICDRIGGLKTLMLGSALQAIALLLFIPFNGLVSLFIISAMFGLFQGGIVPSYAIIVREFFGPKFAGAHVGTVIMATLLGMALGGWMSGKIFDYTGSYQAAFMNGVAWNIMNLAIAFYMLRRSKRLNAVR
jgi:MFS family permease